MFRKNCVLSYAGDFLLFILGGALYAVSVSIFAAPNQIAPGGLTGIATLLHSLLGTPIGGTAALMNLPIIFCAALKIGYRIVLKTMFAIGISSLLIDLCGAVLPPYMGNPLLAAVFAGVLEGIGLSLIFLRGGTTGGTDLTARLLARRISQLSMGKLMFGIDFLIICISSIVYKSLESGLYALITIFISTKVIDSILYGMDTGTGKLLLIISRQHQEILQYLLHDKCRGVTILESEGAYSGSKRPVLLCAARKYEVAQILRRIQQIDEKAFLIIGEAGQISGEGFESKEKPDKTLKELLIHKRQ